MDFHDLLVWQQAIDLSDRIYDLTTSFPKEETYGLISQLRRSAVSVASNIAEGEGRLTRGERRQALSQARGSLFEIETQLLLARRLGYKSSDGADDRVAELRRMLDAYIVYVR